jgi:hypothetical protein
MVLGQGYKLIFDRRDGTTELYDLRADPAELRDTSGEHPERVRTHLNALAAFEAKPGVTGGRLELSNERIEALRELGYAE